MGTWNIVANITGPAGGGGGDVSWDDITDKPAVIAAGADKPSARGELGLTVTGGVLSVDGTPIAGGAGGGSTGLSRLPWTSIDVPPNFVEAINEVQPTVLGTAATVATAYGDDEVWWVEQSGDVVRHTLSTAVTETITTIPGQAVSFAVDANAVYYIAIVEEVEGGGHQEVKRWDRDTEVTTTAYTSTGAYATLILCLVDTTAHDGSPVVGIVVADNTSKQVILVSEETQTVLGEYPSAEIISGGGAQLFDPEGWQIAAAWIDIIASRVYLWSPAEEVALREFSIPTKLFTYSLLPHRDNDGKYVLDAPDIIDGTIKRYYFDADGFGVPPGGSTKIIAHNIYVYKLEAVGDSLVGVDLFTGRVLKYDNPRQIPVKMLLTTADDYAAMTSRDENTIYIARASGTTAGGIYLGDDQIV